MGPIADYLPYLKSEISDFNVHSRQPCPDPRPSNSQCRLVPAFQTEWRCKSRLKSALRNETTKRQTKPTWRR
jgi:hypothetical protein